MVPPTRGTQGANEAVSLLFSSFNIALCSPGSPCPEHRQKTLAIQNIMGHSQPLRWLRVPVLSWMHQLWVLLGGFQPVSGLMMPTRRQDLITAMLGWAHTSRYGNKWQEVAQAASLVLLHPGSILLSSVVRGCALLLRFTCSAPCDPLFLLPAPFP